MLDHIIKVFLTEKRGQISNEEFVWLMQTKCENLIKSIKVSFLVVKKKNKDSYRNKILPTKTQSTLETVTARFHLDLKINTNLSATIPQKMKRKETLQIHPTRSALT